MSEAETVRARRRRKAPWIVGGALGALALGLWVARAPIAERFIQDQLAKKGVPARYTIERIGLSTQRMARRATSLSRQLAAVFGPGMKLRRITIRKTRESITSGISRRLKWLDSFETLQRKLSGSDGLVVSSNALAENLDARSFAAGR